MTLKKKGWGKRGRRKKEDSERKKRREQKNGRERNKTPWLLFLNKIPGNTFLH